MLYSSSAPIPPSRPPRKLNLRFQEKSGQSGISDYLSFIRNELGTPVDPFRSYKIGEGQFKAHVRIVFISKDIEVAHIRATEHVVIGGAPIFRPKHPFYEFHLGRVNDESNKQQEQLKLVDPNKAFNWYADERFELFIIRISKNILLPMLGNSIDSYIGKSLGLQNTYCKTLSSFVRSAFPVMFRSENPMEVGALAAALLDLIIGAFSNIEPNVEGLNSGNALLLKAAMEFMDSNFLSEDLTPETIAEELKISRSHLYSLFRSQSLSVSREIWSRRLIYANSLLKDPRHLNKTISEIAFTCGFNSLAHFSRMYRSKYSVSPRKAREKIMKEKKTGCH